MPCVAGSSQESCEEEAQYAASARFRSGWRFRRCTRLHRAFIVQYNKAHYIVVYCSVIVTSQST